MTNYEVFLPDDKNPQLARQQAVFFETGTQRELLEKIAEHERMTRPHMRLPYDLCIIVHERDKPDSIAVIQRRDTGLHVINDSGIVRPEPALPAS